MPRSTRGLALRQAALRCVLEFDREGLERLPLPQIEPVDQVVSGLIRRWRATFDGASLPDSGADAVDAIAEIDPSVRVEWHVQDAMASLRDGDLALATTRARRTSRMAATEEVLQGEYLANLVLARVRRHAGTPHYAIRILSALHAVVPAPWRTWIHAELMLAGHAPDDLRVCVAATLDRVAAHHDLVRDLACYRALTEVALSHSEARAFVAGHVHDPPFGLRDPVSDPLCLAAVVAGPNATPRRVFRVGLDWIDVEVLEASTPARRLHKGLSVLLLAGERGLDRNTFFEQIYGFARQDPGHDEILRGLVHRMRKAHASLSIESGEQLVARASALVAVPDPRCERTLEDRILTMLAGASGRATAKEIANVLRVPLRTVQRSLGVLVESGSCHGERDGRRTEYIVDDTTFSEPTIHRLRGRY